MPQRLIQTQEQKLQQIQQQRLSQLQLLHSKLLGMSLTELEENIQAELDDNPALEKDYEESFDSLPDNNGVGDNDDNNDTQEHNDEGDELGFDEAEEREDELNSALENMNDDSDKDYDESSDNYPDGYSDIPVGENESFYDSLNQQMNEMELTDREHIIMEYLIGSLESDGLLHKQLDFITDELAIYHYIEVSEEELRKVLKKLQTFEPTGVGATSLQECLRLQIEKKQDLWLRVNMIAIVDSYFDEFKKKHWNTIQSELNLTDKQTETLQQEMRKLNPKPGAAMSEVMGKNTEQITPDFIVETDDNGKITFYINNGKMPKLVVADDFIEGLSMYDDIPDSKLSSKEQEGKKYYKTKIDKANIFIEALRQRQHTMEVTMKAIIQKQRRFFLEGDEADLKPMILKDIAEKTNLDISTISRVSNQKFVETQWGIFPLKFFFTDAYTTEEGEEMSTKKIKLALKEIIDKEDKKHPLSDEALAMEMKKIGYPIARRTIAKYREQMAIPVARLRR